MTIAIAFDKITLIKMKREMNMYCNKCGQLIPDGVYYCEHCGASVNESYTQQPFNTDNQYQNEQQSFDNSNPYQNTQQTYQQPNNQYAPFGQMYTPQAYEYMIDNKLEEARTMGIIAIIAGLFIPILGIVLGCIGISKLNEIPLSNQYRYEKELKRKKAKNLCIVGIALPLILWILALILVFLVLGITMSALY